MTGMKIALVLLCAALQLASAEWNPLFKPIKEGADVGLVVVPGAYLTPDQYGEVVEFMQEESEFALWVYVEDEPTATFIPRRDFVTTATGYLREAGFPEGAPLVSIGHSMGGAMMIFELEETPSLVDGLITWGADGFITSDNVDVFQVPAMTIAGDLDGLTRVTMLAKQFRELSVLPEEKRLIYPVRTMTGLNHISFNTGQVPTWPAFRDLPADIEGPEARRIIAKENAFFIDFCARQKLGEDTSADMAQLREWLDFQTEFYAPLLSAMDMELTPDETESPWVKEAQRIIGGITEEQVDIWNKVTDRDGLVASSPAVLTLEDGTVIGNTTASLNSQALWQSAKTLGAKMSNRDRFDEVLNRDPTAEQPTCRDANVAVWWRIYASISDLARSRFEATGYTVNFKVDVEMTDEVEWAASGLEFEGDGSNLNIGSTFITTSSARNCKLLSPYRVLEFLYLESLRPGGF